MTKGNALPPVEASVHLDDSALKKGSSSAKKFGDDVKQHMQGSRTHTLRFTESLTTMSEHLGGLPPIVGSTARSMESMFSSGAKGMAGLSLAGGVAAVAVGVVAGVAMEAEAHYVALAEQVENFKRVSGASAEESSRLVFAVKVLGVDSESVSQAIFKMNRNLTDSPEKLRKLGIEAAQDSKGNIDLVASLGRVADAYVGAGTASEKDAIVFAAFGKAGREMIPILEQGSAGLKDLEAAAGLVFSEADLERIKEQKIHVKEAQSAWDEFTAQLGHPVLEAQAAVADSILRTEYVTRKMDEAQKAQLASGQQQLGNTRAAAFEFGREWDAAQKVKHALDEQTQASKDAADAANQLATDIGKVVDADSAMVNAGFAAEKANLRIQQSSERVFSAQTAQARAAQELTKRQTEYDDAVRIYGANSQQATDADLNLRDAYSQVASAGEAMNTALIEQRQAYYDAAAAARKLQEDTDMATLGHKDARKEIQVYIAQLQAEADSLAPDSPLRKNLLAYIQQLRNDIPADITTRITYSITRANAEGRAGDIGLLAYQYGGRPTPGVPALIGDAGPEIWTPDRPGTITPLADAAKAPLGGDTFNFHQVKAEPWQIQQDVSWIKKTRRL